MQTTPLAELVALAECLRSLGGDSVVWSDHRNHVEALARGEAHCRGLEHADVWAEVWSELGRARLAGFRVDVRWLSSHPKRP